jgi:hypothetical protein
VLTAAITTGVMIEQLPRPFPTVDVAVPAYFERLRAEQDAGVLLEVPIPADPSIYPKRMLYQTIHQKPVFGGYLSRSLPPLAFDRFPGFAEFKQLSLDADVIAKTSGNARASLATFGAGRVVIEKRLLKEDELGHARMVGESLLGPPVYEDAQILAYDVRPEPRTSALWLGEGWSYLERLEQGDRRDRWRWMSERARFGVAAPSRGFVRLRLTAHAFDETRRLRIARDGVELTTIAVGLGIRRYETPPFELTAGVHYLDVESLDGAKSPGNDPRRLSVAIHEVVLESVEFGQ